MDVNLSDATIFAGNTLRDQRNLRLAVMWQTGFLDEHPEALNRMSDVASAGTSGNTISFREGVENGYLAPLAAKALSRLSWFGRTGGTSIPTPIDVYLKLGQTEVIDEGYPPWKPL
jgi:hypothetical protein